MYRETIVIPNIEKIERNIRRLAPDLAYFLLTDPDLPAGQGMLAKVFFEPGFLRGYLESLNTTTVTVAGPEPLPELELDDEPPDDSELQLTGVLAAPDEPGDEDDEQDTAGDESLNREYTHEELLEASILWLKEQVDMATNDCPSRSFIFRAYSPKGSRVLMTANFTAENRAYRPPRRPLAPPPPLPDPASSSAQLEPTNASASSAASGTAMAPTERHPASGPASWPAQAPYPPPPGMLLYPANYHDGTLFGTRGAFQALNEGYQQFSNTMVGGTTQLQRMMMQVLHDMGHELHSARGQVNQLVDSVLDHRVQQVEAEANAQEAIQKVDQRTALGQQAIQQIGDAVKAFMVTKGMSPESAELMSTLSSHPGLMATLQEPEVREMLSDQHNLDLLARSLRQLGQHNLALKASGQEEAGATGAAQLSAGQGALAGGTAPLALPAGGAPMAGQAGAGSPTFHGAGGAPTAQQAGWMGAPGAPTGGYPGAATTGSFPTTGRAQVAVSPGLAARAAARAIYNSQGGGHPGMQQAPMVPAQPWPGPQSSYPPPSQVPPGFAGGPPVGASGMYPPQHLQQPSNSGAQPGPPVQPTLNTPPRAPSSPHHRRASSRLPSADNAEMDRDGTKTSD